MLKWIVLAVCLTCAFAVKEQCKTNDDCGDDECCVTYIFGLFDHGHCNKLREEGESCTPLEKKEGGKPNMYHFQCPCKEGMDCIPQHEIEIFGHVIKHRPECVVPGKKEE